MPADHWCYWNAPHLRIYVCDVFPSFWSFGVLAPPPPDPPPPDPPPPTHTNWIRTCDGCACGPGLVRVHHSSHWCQDCPLNPNMETLETRIYIHLDLKIFLLLNHIHWYTMVFHSSKELYISIHKCKDIVHMLQTNKSDTILVTAYKTHVIQQMKHKHFDILIWRTVILSYNICVLSLNLINISKILVDPISSYNIIDIYKSYVVV